MAISVVAVAPAAAQAQQDGFGDVAGVHQPNIDVLNEMALFEGTLCGENMFCPDDPIKRSTMAVWLVRALDGADPEPVSGTRFADVDGSHRYAALIERFAELGVTSGCGVDPLTFCPDDPVNRAQMATFLVRAFDLPEGESAGFTDTAGNFHAPNIDRLAAAGVTAGCDTEPLLYCPNKPVSRAQMATFLARALGLAETPGGSAQEGSGSTAITGGHFHSCAIRADDTLTCWGLDLYGLDDPPPGTHKAVTAGWYHACAIRTDDTITCWGDNASGQANAPAGTYKAVTVGWSHSCAIRTDGTITCWGDSTYGQADAPEGTHKAVTAGQTHTCAIRTDGTIICWGDNEHDQTDAPEGTYEAVTAASSHTCALRADGTINCWGSDGFGETKAPAGTYKAVTAGGNHSCAIRTDDSTICWGYNASAQIDAPAGTYRAVAAGATHTCAIRSDGTIACWGDPQVSPPDELGATVEVPDESTETPASSGFVSVEAGTAHACGVRADKTVQCWGDDTHGQSSPPSGEFISVSAGHQHSCGVRVDNTVVCWGSNRQLQSGNFTGGTVTCSFRNGQLVCDEPYDPPEGQFISVSTGNFHSCGLQTDNTIRCWGFVNISDEGPFSTPLMVAPSGDFTAVSSGAFHACGVRADNTVLCWGDDGFGQDHQPDGQFAWQPQGQFISVSAGGAHACGVRSDNTVLCWGNNHFGQSGTADQTSLSCIARRGESECFHPFEPPEGQFISVSAGWVHTCGVHPDNRVSCWGDDTYGQLSVPAGEFISVAADHGYTCGLRPNNTIECWGRNDEGEGTPPTS